MIKSYYLKELCLTQKCGLGSRGNDVKKIQEWLNLWRYARPDWALTRVDMDGAFGPQTVFAVKEFQRRTGQKPGGLVDQAGFQALCRPLALAYQPIKLRAGAGPREYAAAFARQHLKSLPMEIDRKNLGPWVRSYMDGNQGPDYPWCMGFVQTVLDQAFSTLGLRFTNYFPRTYSCDVMGGWAVSRNRLVPNGAIPANLSAITPGDLFLIRHPDNRNDWVHTGIIEETGPGYFTTIEGNTNDEGSREGFEVCRRRRDLRTERLDVVKV